MTGRLSGAMSPIILLLILSGCFLAEGIPSTEEKQTSAILKRLEAKIEKQDAVIDELHGKNEALRRDMSDQLKSLESKANRTEEALQTVRDLPYIMMCAFRGSKFDTGIIAYDRLTLDYSNCDRPGGGCSAMDIASGTFTAQTGGLYTVTFSGQADLVSDSVLIIYLRHNGSKLQESYSSSYSK